MRVSKNEDIFNLEALDPELDRHFDEMQSIDPYINDEARIDILNSLMENSHIIENVEEALESAS